MKKFVTLLLLCAFGKASAAENSNFGLFVHPMLFIEEMAIIYPLGIEAAWGMSNWSASMAYAKLETAPMIVVDSTSLFQDRLFRGSVFSIRSQYSPEGEFLTGWLGEVGLHYVRAEKSECRVKTDSSCVHKRFVKHNGFDATASGGYGIKFGESKFKYHAFSFVGYRYQSYKTRANPLDIRIGLGTSF